MTFKGICIGIYQFITHFNCFACLRGVTETVFHASPSPEANINDQVAHDIGRITGDFMRIPLQQEGTPIGLITNTSADVTRLIGDIGMLSSGYEMLVDRE